MDIMPDPELDLCNSFCKLNFRDPVWRGGVVVKESKSDLGLIEDVGSTSTRSADTPVGEVFTYTFVHRSGIALDLCQQTSRHK